MAGLLNRFAGLLRAQVRGFMSAVGRFVTAVVLAAGAFTGTAFAASDLDLAFDADVRSFGRATVVAYQADGKMLAGGLFTSAGGAARTNLARFNADGSLDNSFLVGTNLNGSVRAIAVQSDGKLLIAGGFTAYGTTAINRVARLNADGTLDATFAPGTGFDAEVLDLALQSDGKLLAVGLFTTFNGTARNRVARLNANGSLDTTFLATGAAANDIVWDVALQSDGKPVIAGAFTAYNGTARNRLARLTTAGALDTTIAFTGGANSDIYSVALDSSGRFVIGGLFTTWNGTARKYIARLTSAGVLDTTFDPGATSFDNVVVKVAVDSAGRVIAAGRMRAFNGAALPAQGIARLTSAGAADAAFAPAEGSVSLGRERFAEALAVNAADGLLVGGSLFDAEGTGAVVALTVGGGFDVAVDFGRGLEFKPVINAVRPGRDGKYWVVGLFDWIGGVPRPDVARFLPNARIDPDFVPREGFGNGGYFNAAVIDGVELPNGYFWAFGAFTKYGVVYDRPGAALFSSSGSPEITSTALTVTGGAVWRALLGSDGKVTLAGTFTSVNGTARAGVARVLTTGALDTAFAPGSGPTGGTILDADLDADGRVLVGGSFTAFSGTAESYLVRLSAAGVVDTAFAGNTNVSALINSVQALPSGKTLIGGIFASSGGYAVNGVDRLNADGTTDVNFNPGAGANSYVYSARADAADRVVLTGAFTTMRGDARPGGLARLSAGGGADNLFTQTALAGGYAFDAALRPDGKILVRGSFTGVDGVERAALARFHSTPVRRGALVTAFEGAVLAAGDVRAVLPAADGGFVLAGDFTTATGVARNRIVKVGQTGALDPAFAYTSGFNATVHGGSLEPDGKFLFWGAFASYNGAGASGVVRVNADGTRDPGFMAPTFNSTVHAVLRLPDGDYLVAGAFTSADATTVGGLVRLNADGSLDAAFNAGTGANGAVLALARSSDGSVFAGGAFTTFAGTSAPGVVKLTANGARAAGFNPGTGNPNAYLPVRALAVQADGKLLVGGEFTTFNGQAVARLIRLNADGTRDAAFLGGLGADATVDALVPLADGRVFVGGAFTSLGGGEQRGLARLTAAGAIDPVFDVGSGFNNEVFAVPPLADGRVAVGGKFTLASGAARNRFAVLYAGSDGAPVLSGSGELQTIEVNSGQAFALSLGDPVEGFNYQWYRDGVLLPGATASTYRVAAAALGDLGTYRTVVSNGAGEVTTVGTRVIVKLAPTVVSAPLAQAVGYGAGATFTVGVSGPGPFTYQWFRDGVAISGQTGSSLVLTNAGDTDFGDTFFVRVTNAYGSFDTTPVALTFDPAAVPGAVVRAFAGQAPVLTGAADALVRTAGGQYYVAGGTKLLRLNADGSTDTSFAPTLTNANIDAMVVQADGKLVAIGYIQQTGGALMRVARFLPSGAIDPSFVVPNFERAQLDSFGNTYYWSGDPLALALQADGKLVIGGDFTRVAGVDRLNLVRLNTDGSLDTGFAPSNASTGANGRISAVIVVGSNLLLAGDFTAYRGTTVNRLVRITSANAIDTTFVGGTRANGPIQGLLRQTDGKLFVRGTFTSYNGTARNRLARLNADGTLDTAFNPGEGPQPNSIGDAVEIRSFALGGNGSLIIGGSFGSFSGWPATRSVRLTSTGAVDTQWSSAGNFSTLLPVSEEEVFVGGGYTFAGLTGTQYLGRLLGGAYPPQPPAFGVQPTGSTYAYPAGSRRTLSALVAGAGTLSLQWYRDGVAVTNSTLITGATGPVLTFRGLRASDAGSYTLRATSSTQGATTSAAALVAVAPEPTGPGSVDLSWAADPAPGGVASLHLAADATAHVTSRIYDGNQYIYYVRKYDANGGLQPASVFDPGTGFDSSISGLVRQSDGKLVVAGGFTTALGTARNTLARLNANGTLDTAFNPAPVGSAAVVLAQTDGKLIVAGNFTSIAGTSRNRIARLLATGAIDTTFAPGAHGLTDINRLLLATDGKVYVFGRNDTNSTDEIVRLTTAGALDGTFARITAPLSSIKHATLDSAGRLVVVGSFTTIAGQSRNRIARFSTAGALDGTFGSTRSSGPSGDLTNVFAAPDGYYYLTNDSYSAFTYDGFDLGSLVRLDANGVLDPNFPAPTATRLANLYSSSLAWTNGKLVVATASSWMRVTVDGGPTGAPVLVGSSGDRTVVEGLGVSLSARFAGSGPFTYVWRRNGTIIAGATGPQLWLASSTSADAGVYTLTATNASGSQTATMNLNFFAADPLSPSVGISLASNFSGPVTQLVRLADGSVLVGGSFRTVAGVNSPGVARIKADGTLDTAFAAALPFSTQSYSGSVETLAVEADGRILVMGNLVMTGETSAYLVRLNANGSLAGTLLTSTNTNSSVTAMALQADGRIVVTGYFSTILGQTRAGLARLLANGTLDPAYQSAGLVSSGGITAAHLDASGRILLAGNFTSVGGVATGGWVVRLKTDGTLDPTFTSGLSNQVAGFFRASDGRLFAFGNSGLAQLAGNAVGVVQLNDDGSMNPAFVAPNQNAVFAMGEDALGRLYVSQSNLLLRLLPGGLADRSVPLSGGIIAMVTAGDRLLVAGGSSLGAVNGVIVPGIAYLAVDAAGELSVAASPVATATVNEGAALTLRAGIRGPAGTTYQWFRNGVAVAGATGSVLVLSNATPAANGSYTLVATSGGNQVTTAASAVTVTANLGRPGEVDVAWGAGRSVTGVSGMVADPAGNVFLYGNVQLNGGATRSVVSLAADGTVRTAFALSARVTGSLSMVVPQANGQLLVGGYSSNLKLDNVGVALLRLNADGSVDNTFTAGVVSSGGYLQQVKVLANGQILAAGGFTTYGGVASSNRVRLSAAGVVDATFTAETAQSETVNAILPAPDGKFWAVGNFIDFTTQSARFFYRLNADGTRDTTFSAPLAYAVRYSSESVLGAAPAPDGGFYFLTYVSDSPNVYTVRRVTAQGSYDPGFRAGQFVRTDYVGVAQLNRLAVDAAGRLLVTGQFASHDGVVRNGIVRLLADGSPDLSFGTPLPVLASQSSAPQLVLPIGNRVLVYHPSLTNYGGLNDRSGLYALHATELPANTAPVLTGTVAPVTLPSFDPLSLTLPVLAPTGASIQWFRNGTAIPGATGMSYRVRSSGPAEAGNYHATVQTSGGTLTVPAFAVTTPGLGYSGALSPRNAAVSIDGTIRFAVAQPDGRILVVSDGVFVSGQGPYELFRLNADGSFHSGLPTQIRGYYDDGSPVKAAVVDGSGRIYLGGSFDKVTGVTRNRVVRLLANGSVDTTWDAGTGPNSEVNKLALAPDGKLFVGGQFSQVGGISRQYLARLDTAGALDTIFVTGTSLNNLPLALVAQSDGRLVVGGNFTTYNGGTATRLIRLGPTGALDATFAPAPNNSVTSLVALADGRLLAGGNFSQVASTARTGIALLAADGALLEPAFNYSTGVTALTAAADGGVFALYGSTVVRFFADGARDTVFTNASGARGTFTNAAATPQSVAPTSVIAVGGEVLVAGPFAKVGTSTRNGLAWIAPSDTLGPVISTAPVNATLPEGGSVQWFVNATATTGTLTYTWTKVGAGTVLSTSAVLARTNLTAADAGTYRVVVSNGEGTAEVTVLLAVTPRAAYTPGAPRVDFYAPTVFSQPAGVVRAADGKWWVINGGLLRRLLPDGSADAAYTPPVMPNTNITTLWQAPDGRLYATGNFTTIDGQPVSRLVRFSAEGVFDPTFVAPFGAVTSSNFSLYALAFAADGRIYVGGSFTDLAVAGRSTNHLVRLLENGAVDNTFDPLGGLSAGDSGRDNVQELAVLPDGRVLVGGSFTTAGGVVRKGLVRFLPTGALDLTFNNIDINSVRQLARLPDGKILAAGSFSTVDGLSRPYLVRLTANGVVDPTFAITGVTLSSLQSFLVRPDGRVVLFAFVMENNVNRGRIIQLLANGSVDPGFDASHAYNTNATGTSGYLAQGVLLPDGNMLVSGSFSFIDTGLARSGLVLVHGSPLAPSIVTPPQSANVAGGTAVTFSVTVSGTPEFTYQWRRNGTPIAGATAATYALASALVADAADYTVAVTNAAGTTISPAATLTVTQSAQTITFSALSDVVFAPTPIPLEASASSGLAVTFAVVSGPATISGGALTLTGPGTVTVRATQTGNAAFLAATPVERTFTASAPLSGFAAWQQGAFTSGELSNNAISGPNADPDGDGFSNLVEYALGLAPKTATTTGLPEVTATASEWVFTYTRPAARSDLTYAVETSSTLTNWTTTNVTHELVSSDGVAGTQTWRARTPLAGATNAFFRLKVTR